MGILLVGVIVLVGALIVVIVNVSAVQLARVRLCDAADAAAVAAADEVSLERLYAKGAGERLPLDTSGVRTAAGRYLRTLTVPDHVFSWGVAEGTGSPDGFTARVVLTGAVRLPLTVPGLLEGPTAVSLTAEGSARAVVRAAP